MALNSWNRALVTGASSGIGEGFARRLAEEGTDLVLVARNGEKLNALAEELSVESEVIVADLLDRQQLAAVEDRLRDSGRPIDLLVNNAGFGVIGDFVATDIDAGTDVVMLNVVALQRLAHAAGSTMAERGRGSILNVSSVAGMAPSPGWSTYGASKAYVTSFSQGLHLELGPLGVHVSVLCPGLTRTEFQERANYDTSHLSDFMWQEVGPVVEAGLKGLQQNKPIVVPGKHNRVFSAVTSVAPSGLTRMAAKALRKREML